MRGLREESCVLMKSKHPWFGMKEAYTSVPKEAVFIAILCSLFAMKKFCFYFPQHNADAVLATL